jgi:hypothetical protein
VIERIEQLALQLATAAAAGQLPQMSCVSTAASNVHMAQQYAAAAARRPAAGSADDDYEPSGSAAAAYGYPASALQFGSGMGADDSLSASEAAAGAGFSQGFATRQQQGQEWEEAEEGGAGNDDDAAAAGGGDGRHHVLRLGSRMQHRTLLANAGAQAHGIVRGEGGGDCFFLQVLLVDVIVCCNACCGQQPVCATPGASGAAFLGGGTHVA